MWRPSSSRSTAAKLRNPELEGLLAEAPARSRRAPAHRPSAILLSRLLRGLSAIYALAGLAIFLLAVSFGWFAIRLPVELEIREGTVWLHALAKRAGVDVYDSSHVAFLNMNHGPVDSMLKGWIATQFPFLAPATVTRLFVFLFPLTLAAVAYTVQRRRWADAFFASGVTCLLLNHLTPMFLVGRSDATSLWLLSIALVPAHRLLTIGRRPWSNPSLIVNHLVLGAILGVAFLTSWRNVPTIGVLPFVVLANRIAVSRGVRWKALAYSIGLQAVAFAAVFLAVFFAELHGDRRLYYKRFFGFFRESGWGPFNGPTFRLFPEEIAIHRLGLLVVVGLLILLAAVRMRKKPIQVGAWLAMLAGGWVAYAFGYYKNFYGGGLHYFFPFFLSVWMFVVQAFRTKPAPLARFALAAVVLWVLPWRDFITRQNEMAGLDRDGRQFLRDVEARTRGFTVLSEDVQLYKRRYQGEKIDMGDTVAVIAGSGYFGENFSAIFRQYAAHNRANPPRFVMAGVFDEHAVSGVMSGDLAEILRKRYKIVLRGPVSMLANGGGRVALFERTE